MQITNKFTIYSNFKTLHKYSLSRSTTQSIFQISERTREWLLMILVDMCLVLCTSLVIARITGNRCIFTILHRPPHPRVLVKQPCWHRSPPLFLFIVALWSSVVRSYFTFLYYVVSWSVNLSSRDFYYVARLICLLIRAEFLAILQKIQSIFWFLCAEHETTWQKRKSLRTLPSSPHTSKFLFLLIFLRTHAISFWSLDHTQIRPRADRHRCKLSRCSVFVCAVFDVDLALQRKVATPGKGILAADESTGTHPQARVVVSFAQTQRRHDRQPLRQVQTRKQPREPPRLPRAALHHAWSVYFLFLFLFYFIFYLFICV